MGILEGKKKKKVIFINVSKSYLMLLVNFFIFLFSNCCFFIFSNIIDAKVWILIFKFELNYTFGEAFKLLKLKSEKT